MLRPLHRLISTQPPVVQHDVIALPLADGRMLDIQRVRDPRAKRIKLSVDERGARLTLPLRASLVSGERFLHEHRAWLAKQLEKYASTNDNPSLLLKYAKLPVLNPFNCSGQASMALLEELAATAAVVGRI